MIEIVLGIAIIGIVSGLLAPIIINSAKSYALVSNQKKILAETRLVVERMESETRLIPDTASITTWTPTQITFSIPNESNISYAVSGGNLLRKGAVIANNVSSLSLSYLDANGNPTAVQANIRRINFEIVFSAGSYGGIKVRSSVYPRRFTNSYAGFQ